MRRSRVKSRITSTEPRRRGFTCISNRRLKFRRNAGKKNYDVALGFQP